ncbi:ArsR/SmtB family transcription factor [Corynebacterium guangdongense]|uniref:DNA-binding transcriptional ArsR family regulator n=1 Tax=Corynebacterium guangdongense TaxID=1783348 RepID=A0ABU1ZYE6_9CORY|nr:metalloregulator ArsR/SmtB family transcription factor [Corynebacterium guangdongense]MDR7329963.1 DNA-binding transcriptional ArsR family regulator [Corynebacterium guangdongense]
MRTQLTGDGGAPPLIYDEEALDGLTDILGALDSKLRIRILLALRQREHVVHELVVALGKSQPLISQHLRVLKRVGIVESERSGREVVYRINSETAVSIIDTAAEAVAEIQAAADSPAGDDAGPAARDDLAVKRRHQNDQHQNDQQRDEQHGSDRGAAAFLGPDDRAPEPGLTPSTPTPPEPGAR